MKTYLILIFTAVVMNAYCQEEKTADSSSEIGSDIPSDSKTDKADQMILDINLDLLPDAPDSVKFEYFSRGVGLNLLYDLPFGKGNVGVAFGLALSVHNYFSNAIVVNQVDTVDNSIYSVLQPFDSDYNYKKNKLSVAYLDVPLELRFRTNENSNGKRFKIFAGGRIGYNINTHSKLIDDNGKYKGYDETNINPFRYGVSFRLAYGNVGLYAYYGLSTLFEEGKGVKLSPISAGISVFLF